MKYCDFAKALSAAFSPNTRNGEIARALFLEIVEPNSPAEEKLLNISEITYRSYFNNLRGIAQPACIAIQYLDKGRFSSFIYNQPLGAQESILQNLLPSCPKATLENIGDKASDLFEQIICDSQRQRRGYAQEKPEATPLVDEILLLTNGHCPSCGQSLIKTGQGRLFPTARKIALLPTEAHADYRIERKWQQVATEVLGEPIAIDAEIILCMDCAAYYEMFMEIDRFRELITASKKAQDELDTIKKLDRLMLEEELVKLLAKLGAELPDISTDDLSYDAVLLEAKIGTGYPLLTFKLLPMITQFYNYIEQQARMLQAQGQLHFDLTAAQVKLAYQTIATRDIAPPYAFELLCDWLQEKTQSQNRIACEILLAYFVQNCEVFDVDAK